MTDAAPHGDRKALSDSVTDAQGIVVRADAEPSRAESAWLEGVGSARGFGPTMRLLT